MTGWIWILTALFILVFVLAMRGRHSAHASSHGRLIRMGRQRKAVPAGQPRTAGGPGIEVRKDPNLVYQGEVWFFCSVEERDACTAQLEHGEYRPSEDLRFPRAIDRHP